MSADLDQVDLPIRVRLEDLTPYQFVTVHRLTSVPGRGVTVVRPDGYIGFRGRTAEAGQLAAWLALVSAALVLAQVKMIWPPAASA